MAGEASTIARPYAEAIFERAGESDKLDLWSEMLGFLAAVVVDPTMARVVGNPLIERSELTRLMLEIAGGRINQEGQNLLRLLVQNGRLPLLPEIARLYEELKADKQRLVNVHVVSAYVLKPAQERQIADALKQKLGREIRITSEKDPDLIGGIHIRAGDLVIDGTVRGRLQQLANELGI